MQLDFPERAIEHWIFENTYPNVEQAYKIASFLDVSIEWLLTGSETAPDSESVAIANEIQRLDSRDRELLKGMIEQMKLTRGVTLTGTA